MNVGSNLWVHEFESLLLSLCVSSPVLILMPEAGDRTAVDILAGFTQDLFTRYPLRSGTRLRAGISDESAWYH